MDQILIPDEQLESYHICCFYFHVSFIRSCKCISVASPLLMLTWLVCPTLALLKVYTNTSLVLGLPIALAFFCFSCASCAAMWVGLRRQRPWLLCPYFVFCCIMTVFRFVAIFVGPMTLTNSDFNTLEHAFFVVNLAALFVDGWFATVVFRCMLYLRAQEAAEIAALMASYMWIF